MDSKEHCVFGKEKENSNFEIQSFSTLITKLIWFKVTYVQVHGSLSRVQWVKHTGYHALIIL